MRINAKIRTRESGTRSLFIDLHRSFHALAKRTEKILHNNLTAHRASPVSNGLVSCGIPERSLYFSPSCSGPCACQLVVAGFDRWASALC